jgi:hypothetical protein
MFKRAMLDARDVSWMFNVDMNSTAGACWRRIEHRLGAAGT